MSVERLQVQQKDPVGQTMFGLKCDVSALQQLANEAQPFFRKEIQELRIMASDMLMIAAQAETRIKVGTK